MQFLASMLFSSLDPTILPYHRFSLHIYLDFYCRAQVLQLHRHLVQSLYQANSFQAGLNLKPMFPYTTSQENLLTSPNYKSLLLQYAIHFELVVFIRLKQVYHDC
jgi:hypothetical protein